MAKIYLDSADPAITGLIRDYRLAGATSNPTILLRDACIQSSFIERVPDEAMYFVQTIGEKASEMIDEGRRIYTARAGCAVKIPATKEGLKAMAVLVHEGIPVLATAIYSFSQAVLALNMGVHYIAPYLNRMLNRDYQGYEIIQRIQHYKQDQRIDCEVVAASFKSLDQILQVIQGGVDAVTVPLPLFYEWIENEDADKAVKDFKHDYSLLLADKHM